MKYRAIVNVMGLVLLGCMLVPILGQESAKKEAQKRIEGLIEKLGAKEVKVREEATRKLTKIGKVVLPYIRKVKQKTDDPEVKSRCEWIEDSLTSARTFFTKYATQAQIKISWNGSQVRSISSLFIYPESSKFILDNFKAYPNDKDFRGFYVIQQKEMGKIVAGLARCKFFERNDLGKKCEAWSFLVYAEEKLHEVITEEGSINGWTEAPRYFRAIVDHTTSEKLKDMLKPWIELYQHICK
jgi:hypothetical protein